MASSSHSNSSHHHHHHKMDGASKFKRKQLLAIERRKWLGKWLLRIGYVVAILMVVAVLTVYYLL